MRTIKAWKKFKEWLYQEIPKGLKVTGPGILSRSSEDIWTDPRSERQKEALKRLSTKDH